VLFRGRPPDSQKLLESRAKAAEEKIGVNGFLLVPVPLHERGRSFVALLPQLAKQLG
jgi:hypothetical protein